MVKIINNQMLGVSVGSATVTATVGTKKVKQKVVVENRMNYFALNSVSVSLYPGETYSLSTGGTTAKVTYSSRNKSVATVDKSGKIIAQKPGTTFIDAKSGKLTKVCAVTVIDKKNQSDILVFKPEKSTTYISKWKFKNNFPFIKISSLEVVDIF